MGRDNSLCTIFHSLYIQPDMYIREKPLEWIKFWRGKIFVDIRQLHMGLFCSALENVSYKNFEKITH